MYSTIQLYIGHCTIYAIQEYVYNYDSHCYTIIIISKY